MERMPGDRLPKPLLCCELCYGKPSVSGQKKSFDDTHNKTLTCFYIDGTHLGACSQERPLPCIMAACYTLKPERLKKTGSRIIPQRHCFLQCSLTWDEWFFSILSKRVHSSKCSYINSSTVTSCVSRRIPICFSNSNLELLIDMQEKRAKCHLYHENGA